MPTTILATKLYLPPPRAKTVVRSRLIEQLNEGLHSGHKLIIISAAAGFGKTTIVSEWIAECNMPAAWMSLDEGDGDLMRFLSYLIAALQTIQAGIGEGLLPLLDSNPPQVEAILTTLLNEVSVVPEHFLVILDDYHLLDSQTVDQALTFLVEHLPPHMHLVIATREDPQLPLSRLRARNQLTELRAADLRFTPSEASEFLNQVMDLTLTPDDVAALETRTEGWIAGLQLAALSMQGQSDPASFIQSFTGSHRFVLDYLLEEVLERQPAEVQSFLLPTSILERHCGALCDAVLDLPSGSGQSILEAIERGNLFLVPLDNERRWYRYHHLFGELLLQRLGNPPELPKYHLRASAWFEANHDWAAAFHHALAAEDFERAARLAEAAWQGMDRRFQTATWIGWVKKLPDAVVLSRPRLCIQLGWAFSDAGELETSETYLQNAERALVGVADSDESRSLHGNIALIRSSNAQNQGDLAETVKYAELSIQLAPENDVYLQSQAAITLGFTHWATGSVEVSLQAMLTWIKDMQRLGNEMFVIASAFAVADMQVILGRLGDAEKTLLQAIQQAAKRGREAALVTTHHHLGLALLAHERGEDRAAAEHMQLAAELGKHSTLVDWLYRWNMAQARLKESAGEWETALALLEEARRVYVKNPVPLLQPVEAHKARIYLKQGRLEDGQAWARDRRISTEDEVCYLDEYDHLTLARVRLAEGSFAGINDMLERLLALAETQKRRGSLIEISVTQALVHHAQNNQPEALAALEHALALAEVECYLRIFLDEGEPMRSLLRELQSSFAKGPGDQSRSLQKYVEKLLSAFDRPVLKQSLASSGNSELIEPLTDREIEILRFIAEGYSNAEISHRLYLALSTVKGHNLRIFNKLQAQNRTEAVARARELGLL